jgi:hypothetical protein
MTLQDLGAIGELVGAIAVVFSLIYLAIQIRLNTRQLDEQNKALNLASINAVEESFSRFRIPVMCDPELANLLQIAQQDISSVPDDRKAQAEMLIWEYVYCWSNFFSRIESGMVTGQEANERVRTNIKNNFKHAPGLKVWWRENRSRFRSSFAAVVDEAYDEAH